MVDVAVAAVCAKNELAVEAGHAVGGGKGNGEGVGREERLGRAMVMVRMREGHGGDGGEGWVVAARAVSVKRLRIVDGVETNA